VLFLTILLSFLISEGCGYTGSARKKEIREIPSKVKTQIIKGKTTKSEVLNILGRPESVYDNWPKLGSVERYERWNYFFERQHFKWSDVFGGELLGFSPDIEVVYIHIYFDKNGIVQDYEIEKYR